MKMKKILALILALALSLSLAACGGGNDAPAAAPNDAPAEDTAPNDAQEPAEEPEPEPEEPTHDVDRIDLETGAGHLVYTGYEFAGESFYSEYVEGDPSKTVILNFDFTNKESKPSGVQSAFSITVYQNGAELDGPSAWAHSTEAMDNFFNTGMQDSTIPVGRAYILKDASPLTVMVEERGNTDNYQMMKIEVAAPDAAGGDTEPADDTGNAGSDAPATKGIWYVDYYVDDFQQPTEDWYITNVASFSGTFSNSATTNSKLLVQVAADEFEGETRVAFFLYEYGRNQVKNSSSNYVDEYDITMRDADGNDTKLTGTVYCGGDRLFVDDSYVGAVLEAMKGGGALSFHIVESDRTTTTYLFSFETDNFGSLYTETAG